MTPRPLKTRHAEESGNGVAVEAHLDDDVWVVHFMAEPRTSPQALWFHLEATGAGGRVVRFIWLNADSCLGLRNPEQLGQVHPVVRANGGDWQRVAGALLDRPSGGHVLRFETPSECRSAAAALCYPYGPADLSAALKELGGAWQRESIGLTAGGRPLPRLRAGPPDGPGVYVVARQHAGETPGSWVLDGLLRAVAEGDAQEPALADVQWWTVPFADLDGVVAGDYGKDALPWDLNRAWRSTPMRPEVVAMQHDLARFGAAAAPRLVLDLHAPGGGEIGLYHFLCRKDRPEPQRQTGESFTPLLAEQFPELPAGKLRRVPDYASRWDPNDTLANWAWDALDGTLGTTIETSYQGLTADDRLEPAGYRGTGARLARAAVGWLTSRG